MPYQIFNTIVTGAGPLVIMNTGGDSILVTNSGQISGEGGPAVLVTGNFTSSAILGLVSSDGIAMDYRLTAANASVQIGATGMVVAGGIGLTFQNTVNAVNYGSVIGGVNGFEFGGLSSVSNLLNYGTIFGGNSAIKRVFGGSLELHVVNYGTIAANEGNFAISADSAGAVENIENRGIIQGDISLGAGADTYFGRNGTLTGALFLGDGADFYVGGNGTMGGNIFCGAGNDAIVPGAAREFVFGEAGTDILNLTSIGATTVALDGSFANKGNALGDTYVGIENVFGSATGSDRIRGDEFANFLDGLGGNDSLEGAAGNDSLNGGAGNNSLFGGAGNDYVAAVDATAGSNKLYGGSENDTLEAGIGNNSLYGGTGNDDCFLLGTGVILGGSGDDKAEEREKISRVDMGEGNDTVISAGVGDTLIGGLGIDTLDLRDGVSQTVNLLAGANTFGDTISGFENVEGSDVVGSGDNITGDASANIIRGNAGDDQLLGGAGNDKLFGDDGRDAVSGGLGLDSLAGGDGDDTFVFQNRADQADRITDFSNVVGNNDRIGFIASGFTGLVGTGFPTAIAASMFQSRGDNLAQDTNDRFIFRTTDRSLWFDSNGSLAGGPTLIAYVQVGAVVTASDIFIF